MLKKLVMIGVFVGSSASVPLLYQSNPQAFHRLVAGQTAQQDERIELANLEPVAKQPSTNALSGRMHMVAMDAQGHFRDEFRLNGRRITALIDTGATLVAINRSTATRIGVKLKQSDFTYEVNTANGITKAAAATIERLQVGRIDILNVQAVVLEDRALSGALIGMSFLKRLDSFKVVGKQLEMEQ